MKQKFIAGWNLIGIEINSVINPLKAKVSGLELAHLNDILGSDSKSSVI
jgi:hypothetical protein